MMNQPAKYDFFISYTSHDQAWAEWIAWQLENNGYSVVLQKWDFLVGEDWVHKMEQAVQQAERVIPVLSPAYVQSKFGQAEWRPFFDKDPSGEKRLIVQVRVADVAPPGLLTGRIFIDLTQTPTGAGVSAAMSRTVIHSSSAAGLRLRPRQSPTVCSTVARRLHVLTWLSTSAIRKPNGSRPSWPDRLAKPRPKP